MASLTSIPVFSKLSSKVIRILGCNPGPMTLQGTNTYLVGTGTKRILIDTGDDGETAQKYVKILDDVLKSEKATIEHMLITHWHHDHIGGIKHIQQMLKSSGSSPKVWKLPRAETDTDLTEVEETTELQSLKDEQILEVEGAKLRIKYTPGHTTDHACVLLEDDNILFSGDCILGEGTAVFEDLHDYLISLRKILELNPRTIYPGHGPVLEEPSCRIEYYIEHRQQRETQILQVLEEHKDHKLSEMDIVKYIYKETPKNLWNAAAINVGHHLQKLYKENKVKGNKGQWYI